MKRTSVILKTGLIAGSLDIVVAFIHYYILTKSNPVNILKYIASGLFGNSAFSGGNTMILAGLVLHYIIALAFTFFFFLLYPKIKALHNNVVTTAILYGIFVWMVMNLVVVPLSGVPKSPFNPANAIVSLIILIVCIGLPLSIMANRYYKRGKKGDGEW